MKAALRDMGPYEFAALRLWLAAGFLFACLAALGRTMRVSNPLAVVLAGLFQRGVQPERLGALHFQEYAGNVVLDVR